MKYVTLRGWWYSGKRYTGWGGDRYVRSEVSSCYRYQADDIDCYAIFGGIF